jgi:hypothetical protein
VGSQSRLKAKDTRKRGRGHDLIPAPDMHTDMQDYEPAVAPEREGRTGE